MKSKKVSETYALKTEIVLPNDTNNLGNLMGGKLLHWMDVITAISAQRASNRTVVTVSVDFVEFKKSIPLGSVVILESRVTRTFNSSLEVRVDVAFENLGTGEKQSSNSAYYTFVAVDQSGRPIPVGNVEPETDPEKELYQGALQRRELRLLLAGRIKADQAKGLKEIFGIDQGISGHRPQGMDK
ncbi:acyl-CoA thioesterase [Pontibacter sp. G13]|uniref:acyl-CoA thioesterase n=1 Tax=Pontibacter sp. G13 TaxID=3074898 RepID=UPI00288C4100|nr:acyl-CoA thioesterase [Pontibacter sp. G13]WNJ16546.1 acyl-CoA thioesterase [Pontibacter sp. G13]